MLIPRSISSICLICLLLASIFIKNQTGLILFGAMAALLTVLAVRELFQLMAKMGYKHRYGPVAAVAAILVIRPLFGPTGIPSFETSFISVVVVVVWLVVLLSDDGVQTLEGVAISSFALIMLTFPLSMFSWMYMIDEGHNYIGRDIVFYTVLVTKSGDIGAYCVGTCACKMLGDDGVNRILPNISPKKTWEGTIGGMIIAVLVSCVLIFNGFIPGGGFLLAVFIGVVLFWGGFTGDLVESRLKRMAKVKDSGKLIPGMGGVLDVIDSLILNAPLMYIMLFYLIFER